MKKQTEAAARMARISELFQAAQIQAESGNRENFLVQIAEEESSFSGIGYEAVSMVIALQSISSNQWEEWFLFLKNNPLQSAQICVGVGWAFSKKRTYSQNFFDQLTTLDSARCIDGMGYCDAFFKQKKIIHDSLFPEWISKKNEAAYFQGVGRALWYLAAGDMDKLISLQAFFSEQNQSHLWRGAGIAFLYVGGIDKEFLQAITTAAGKFSSSLKAGILLAAISRFQSNVFTDDFWLIAHFFFPELNSNHLMDLKDFANSNTDDYLDLLEKMRKKYTFY